MAAPIIRGLIAEVLSKGALSRAVRILRREPEAVRAPIRALSRVFVDVQRRNLTALRQLAEQSIRAGQRATLADDDILLFDLSPACHGIRYAGPLQGAIGRTVVEVPSPLGGDPMRIVFELTGRETRGEITQRAIEQAASVIQQYPEKFGGGPLDSPRQRDLEDAIAAGGGITFLELECARNP